MTTTVKPNAIFKFDYLNYGKIRTTPQIELFRKFRNQFMDTNSMIRFLDLFMNAFTSDFGVIKSFYDIEDFDEDEEDAIDDDPASKTIPMSQFNTRNIPEFVNMLRTNGRKRNVTDKYIALGRELLQMERSKEIVQALINIIASDSFYVVKNRDSYPIVEIDDQTIEDLLVTVKYKSLRKSKHMNVLKVARDFLKESSMKRISETHSEKYYHNKMVALKTMDGGITMIEESKKKELDETNGLCFNLIGLPSFVTTFNYTGMNIWDSVSSLSKIKLIRCAIPEKST